MFTCSFATDRSGGVVKHRRREQNMVLFLSVGKHYPRGHSQLSPFQYAAEFQDQLTSCEEPMAISEAEQRRLKIQDI